jgi:hypothetical protein
VHKRHGVLDNKLWTRHCLDFIVEIIKVIIKKKRTLALYSFCMTKKDLLSEVGLAKVSYYLQLDKRCSVAVY